MIDQLLVCSALLTSSPSAQALGMINQTCINDSFKSYKDLYQKTASFVGDNRTLLEKDGARFGASQKDVEQNHSSMGAIRCPGTKYGNPGIQTGTIIQAKNILATNIHALVDESGQPRDPLSQCAFYTQDELLRKLPGHSLGLGDGLEGLQKAQSANILAHGTRTKDNGRDDWAVIKLADPPSKALPLKLPSQPIALHGCKVEEEYKCQKLISMTAHDRRLPGIGDSPWGSTVVSSFSLYNYTQATSSKDIPSMMSTDQSAYRGASGGISFLANSDGTLVRINGQLVPIALLSGGPKNDEVTGVSYNGGANIGTVLVGLDGNFASAIRRLAGEKQTTEKAAREASSGNGI